MQSTLEPRELDTRELDTRELDTRELDTREPGTSELDTRELESRATDPHDVFVIEPDVVLAARADHTPSGPTHDPMKGPLTALVEIASGVAAGTSSAPPSVDTTFRATDVNHIPRERTSTGRLAKRVFMALFALCGAIAAAGWQHYGAAATEAIANWIPPLALTSSPQPEKYGAPEQPGSPIDQTSAPAAATDAAAQAVDPAQVQSMTRDLASMGQQIEQLKASLEELKTGQQQMSRDIAKNPEKNLEKSAETGMTAPNPRPRLSAISPPPRPVAPVAPARKPRPAYAYSPAPAAAAPMPPPATAMPVYAPPPEPPAQATIQPDGEPVVRPPMPLH